MAQPPEPTRPRSRPLRRAILLLTGTTALVLGLLGVILPLVPTTPFILLAAACFAGSWPAMHDRIARSRHFGPMLRADPEDRHLPLRTKVGAIVFTWLSIGATIVFAVHSTRLRIALAVVAAGVTWFLLWMPSQPRNGCGEGDDAP